MINSLVEAEVDGDDISLEETDEKGGIENDETQFFL